MTNFQQQLQQAAISAAKAGDWPQAVELNQQLIDSDSSNLAAYNRLGTALLQLGKTSQAKKIFQQVLDQDRSNLIAKKNLTKIKSKQTSSPTFSNQFIEEPGKTRTTQLRRIANKHALQSLKIGQNCELKPKNRFISVEVDGVYIGSLAEDISFRLSKLIAQGNQYQCLLRSIDLDNCQCTVFLKEVATTLATKGIRSFPALKITPSSLADFEESIPNEPDENIPVVIVHTDDDEDEPEEKLSQVDTND